MSVEIAPAPARLRLLPVPAVDPPYDDERDPTPITDGSLALAFPPPVDALPLRLVPPAEPIRDADALRDQLPDPREWGTRFAQAVVEVLVGVRTAAQLSRYTSLDVLHKLERWTGRLAVAPGGAPARRPRVASVHVCAPRDGVVEASAGVDTGIRRRAIALRFECNADTWRCTALELG
jgi:hypothetical protein